MWLYFWISRFTGACTLKSKRRKRVFINKYTLEETKVKYSHLVQKYFCQHELFVDFWSFLENAGITTHDFSVKWQCVIQGEKRCINLFLMARTPCSLRVVGFYILTEAVWHASVRLVYDTVKQR